MAKGMGGGLPVAAVTGRADVMDSIHAGGLGGTYGGNPIALAGALGAIETINNAFNKWEYKYLYDSDPTHIYRPKGSEIRRMFEENGVLFIADEVQTGFARTGSMFASDHEQIVPDLITMAKGPKPFL